MSDERTRSDPAYFAQVDALEIARLRIAELESALRDLLDSHFEMSPLQYAQSRGLPNMSDAEGEKIVSRARTALRSSAQVGHGG